MEQERSKLLSLEMVSLLDDGAAPAAPRPPAAAPPAPRLPDPPAASAATRRAPVIELVPLGSDLGPLLLRPASTPEPGPRPEPTPEPTPAGQPAPQRTVLVVDDDKDYRRMVRHLLFEHRYNVIEAEDGAQAMATLLRQRPDLILVDYNMPRMNGYELIQEVRSRYETRATPIIMFTAAANRSHLRSLRMDISDFLEKPVPNATLLESLAKALEAAPQADLLGALDAPQTKTVLPPEAPETPSPSVVPEHSMAEEPPAAQLEEPPPAETAELLRQEDDDGTESLEIEGDATDQEKQEVVNLENQANESPVINQVNRILIRAVSMRASDIHIEPQEHHITVRVRVDGALKVLCTLPVSIHPRLAARIKIMSSLVITERRLPQDGQFRVQVKGSRVEFRVSTIPSVHGEKIVMRILGTSKLKGDLTQMRLPARDQGCLEKALNTPHGLILVTGPTGSGKTTTLYTMINMLNRPDVNILTAEDPVEYELPNISQVKVLPAIGLTFESVLRAFLRQDPDIMLIGEIRDLETANIAVKASITGHLVFSTLHTNGAVATVTRLVHMGVAPYLVAASVRMVVAQRLVRELCPACKVPVQLSDEEKKFLSEDEIDKLKTVWRHVGCPQCHQIGYTGRRAVFEVMPVDSPAMRQLICSGDKADLLNDLALQEGMTTLRQSALAAVAQGATSLHEALKVMMGG
ncbi:MAG: Flp pilus assembly complex ATPase component TadA [Elusimicrobia bacterium]|nr:Flp pilus assembly complex ATPase component TadA [Elusimicrobiota bacterium]